MTTRTINKLFWLASALLVLAACSKEEPAAVEETAPVAEEQVIETGEEAVTEDVAEPSDEALEVVEESAAEPEDTGETAIILAQADTTAATTNWKFDEGRHYIRLVPSQPTIGGADKIEVAEFFWYGCGHCYNFEPTINQWDENKPANVRFERVPVMWNDVTQIHARLYYTEEVLARNGAIKDPAGFRAAVFDQFHNRGNRLLTEEAIGSLFERYGVGSDDFLKTWNSFEVSQKLRVANDLGRRYSISSVPMIVVNGKFRTGANEAGGNQGMIDVIDELIVRESAR